MRPIGIDLVGPAAFRAMFRSTKLTDRVLPDVPVRRRGRDVGYPAPPAQNPARTGLPPRALASKRWSRLRTLSLGISPWARRARQTMMS